MEAHQGDAPSTGLSVTYRGEGRAKTRRGRDVTRTLLPEPIPVSGRTAHTTPTSTEPSLLSLLAEAPAILLPTLTAPEDKASNKR